MMTFSDAAEIIGLLEEDMKKDMKSLSGERCMVSIVPRLVYGSKPLAGARAEITNPTFAMLKKLEENGYQIGPITGEVAIYSKSEKAAKEAV